MNVISQWCVRLGASALQWSQNWHKGSGSGSRYRLGSNSLDGDLAPQLVQYMKVTASSANAYTLDLQGLADGGTPGACAHVATDMESWC